MNRNDLQSRQNKNLKMPKNIIFSIGSLFVGISKCMSALSSILKVLCGIATFLECLNKFLAAPFNFLRIFGQFPRVRTASSTARIKGQSQSRRNHEIQERSEAIGSEDLLGDLNTQSKRQNENELTHKDISLHQNGQGFRGNTIRYYSSLSSSKNPLESHRERLILGHKRYLSPFGNETKTAKQGSSQRSGQMTYEGRFPPSCLSNKDFQTQGEPSVRGQKESESNLSMKALDKKDFETLLKDDQSDNSKDKYQNTAASSSCSEVLDGKSNQETSSKLQHKRTKHISWFWKLKKLFKHKKK